MHTQLNYQQVHSQLLISCTQSRHISHVNLLTTSIKYNQSIIQPIILNTRSDRHVRLGILGTRLESGPV